MPRPPRCRRICEEPAFGTFGPEQGTDREPVILQVDEYETIRLVDLEGATHEECARIMDISRTTVTEIYESARHKIADALVISPGNCALPGEITGSVTAPPSPTVRECVKRAAAPLCRARKSSEETML